MARTKERYWPEELDKLYRLYHAGASLKDMAKAVNRGCGAVQTQIYLHKWNHLHPEAHKKHLKASRFS